MTEKHANIDLWKSAPLAEIDNPHPKNPRKIPAEDSDEIRTLDASLEHDYFDPLIWNKRNRMWVSGHVRAWRMRVKGYTHLDVVVVDYDEDTHLARMLAANAHSGTNDDDKLATLLTSLRESQVDPVLALMASLPEAPVPPGEADAEPQIDRAEELNKIWQVNPGDVWQIGPHRLMCGDSTKQENVDRVMGGSVAALMNTDPPYGVSAVGGTKDPRDAKNYRSGGTIENDELTKDRLCEFLTASFSCAQSVLTPGAAWYVWFAGIEIRAFMDACEVIGGFKHILIWVKENFVFGRCDYHYRHEPVLYGWTAGAGHKWYGKRNQDSVWGGKVGDDIEKKVHPTAKPLSITLGPILNHTLAGEIVYDPFLGSGTTIVAAQNLNRICYGMEISPGYCAVILDRMQRAFPDLEIQRLPAPAPV